MDSPSQQMLQLIGATLTVRPTDPDALTLTIAFPFRMHELLLIDDNPDVIALFRRYLSGQPYHLTALADGESAFDVVRDQQPGVVILDLMLPRQDGYAILQSLKNHPDTAHIPVMICSVLDTPELVAALGADRYLKKPPGQAEFLLTLESLLR